MLRVHYLRVVEENGVINFGQAINFRSKVQLIFKTIKPIEIPQGCQKHFENISQSSHAHSFLGRKIYLNTCFRDTTNTVYADKVAHWLISH